MPGNFVIDNKLIPAPDGITATNYLESADEPHFKHRRRKKNLKHFVLHETAGRSASGCKKTLLRKGYGVQLILARNGVVSCHGDLLWDRMVHGNQLNNTSIGIEVVNPYAPRLAKGMNNIQTIPAKWWTWCMAGDRRYVLPTQEQLNTLVILVPWLCGMLNIPYTFPTQYLNAKRRKIRGWNKPPRGWRAKPKPGVVAHSDFARHSDGVYLREYLANLDS